MDFRGSVVNDPQESAVAIPKEKIPGDFGRWRENTESNRLRLGPEPTRSSAKVLWNMPGLVNPVSMTLAVEPTTD
jgi:hypothetical protein